MCELMDVLAERDDLAAELDDVRVALDLAAAELADAREVTSLDEAIIRALSSMLAAGG